MAVLGVGSLFLHSILLKIYDMSAMKTAFHLFSLAIARTIQTQSFNLTPS